ncbi:glycosyltransferase family 4 protein [Aquamicrobium sp.]|uniref:glycosyltransferase family 4 protein n=1 Tax=Aquamicrobium sp. TaxID=1872579 RepID=UPI00258A18A3|nr:glycosyltransferase family 4 protein [Aquamicrobium sp.]MCK9549663.1 glycosyltransferase family 4 protein [Aquamicrobium sp.]
MKHVWILNHYAQEPGGAGGTRHFSLGRYLPESGWKATIIAASTEHPTGRQRLDDGESFRLDVHDGVPFLWLRTPPYFGNGTDRIRNMLAYTRAVLKSENLSRLDPPDVIIGSSVHPLAAWAGRRLARRYGVPFVFEVRDLWPQTLIDMGRLTYRHPLAVALRWLETSLYRSAQRTIVLLPKAGEYIEPLGIPQEKIVWIPNGADLDLFVAQEVLTSSDTFTLMYFGAHGGANGLETVLQAMQIVGGDPANERIVLRLIGDGPLKPSLIAKARELGLKNVRFEEPVPKNRIPEIAAEADAFVFNLIDAPVFRYGISSNKLFDFMAAQRPVLFCSASANNPIAETGAGMTIPPANPAALAAAIVEMASLPAARRREMGEAGRRYLESNHSMALLARRLATTLDECIRA